MSDANQQQDGFRKVVRAKRKEKDLRTVLASFSKETLIEFYLEQGLFFRGDANQMEADLLSIEWKKVSEEGLAELKAAGKKRDKAKTNKDHLLAMLDYEKAQKKLDRADRLFNRMMELREA